MALTLLFHHPCLLQGEESEDWDDFYGSYRPRHVGTEDAREAVWATDEFESDEDNTESEWEPEYVGAGLGLRAEDPFNPQVGHRSHCTTACVFWGGGGSPDKDISPKRVLFCAVLFTAVHL
jgi:hypothetical protein